RGPVTSLLTGVLEEDLVEHAPRTGEVICVVGIVTGVRTGGQCLPQRPAAPTRPGVVVDGKALLEHLPPRIVQQRPGDREIAGRIADSAGPEVDDGRQHAVGEKEIPRGDVTVEPALDAIPRRREGLGPDLASQADVDMTPEDLERALRALVVGA